MCCHGQMLSVILMVYREDTFDDWIKYRQEDNIVPLSLTSVLNISIESLTMQGNI